MNAEDRFWNAKVTVEISTTEVMQLAEEVGMPLSPAEIADFLNNEVRAKGMWNHMMQAGRDYIAASLETRRHRGWWEHSCGKTAESEEKRYDA